MISIHTFSADSVWQKASEFLINWLRLYHNIGQKTLLLLSGGSVVKIYAELTREMRENRGDWGVLAIGQIDERFQPENKDDINAVGIGKTGLWEICKEKNIPNYLVSQGGTLEEVAEKYEKQLSDLFEHFPYKIGVLGIGEDCHTAGCLPGYEKEWNRNVYAVGYTNNGRFSQRITVTPKVLLYLDQAVCVAVGKQKNWP